MLSGNLNLGLVAPDASPLASVPYLTSVGRPQMQVSLECLELPEVRGRRRWAGNVAQRLHGSLLVRLALHLPYPLPLLPSAVVGLGTRCSLTALWEPEGTLRSSRLGSHRTDGETEAEESL